MLASFLTLPIIVLLLADLNVVFKGVMEDMFEQDREDTLSAADKSTCQKLLLMVSVKDKLFTEDQRNTAKKLLARLEGDRRRKCRASEGRAIRGGVDDNDLVSAGPSVREELLIVSSKKKRKRGTPRKGEDASSGKDFKGTQGRESEIDGDGFKVNETFFTHDFMFIRCPKITDFQCRYVHSFTPMTKRTGAT